MEEQTENGKVYRDSDFSDVPSPTGAKDLDRVNKVYRDSDFAPEKTEDDYILDPQFQADAATLAPWLGTVSSNQGAADYLESQQGIQIGPDSYPSIEEMQAGMAQANEDYVADPEEVARDTMDAIGQKQWNMTDLGITAANIGDWPEEAQMALIRTMKAYDDVPFEKQHAWRAATGIVTDPTTYLGFGTFRTLISKVALKNGATKLLASLASKPVVAGATVGLVEGAAYTALDNTARQVIDNQGDVSKVDKGEVLKQAGIGAGFGLTLGGFFAKAFNGKSKKTPSENANGVEVARLDGEPYVESSLPTSEAQELDELSKQNPRLANESAEAGPEYKDDSVTGELLDDGSGTDATLTPQRDVVDDTPLADGTLDSLDNAQTLDGNSVGEDTSHWYDETNTFNTDRLETIDNVKEFIETSSAHWEKVRMKSVDGNPDGVESLESARAKADVEAQLLKEETGGDISEILNKFKDDHVELQKIRHRAQALRKLNVALGERVHELATKQSINGLGFEESAEFIEKVALFANTMELSKLASREFSRGLGNYRLIMKGDTTLMDNLRTGKAQGDVSLLAKNILAMSTKTKGKLDLKGVKRATDKLKDTTFLQELIRFRSAMMLSGPSTIEAAGLSNVSRLWSEPMWEWLGNIGFTTAKKRARVRAFAQFAGNKRFFAESWKQASKAYKNGQHITDPMVTQVENQRDDALANMSWVRRNLWERGVHQAHLALLFLDEGIKANRSRSLIYSDTFVDAVDKKIDPASKEFDALLEQNLAAKIDKNGRLLDKEILREIRETTFTADLEGDVGKTLNMIANFGGGYGRLIVVPFIRAPINIVSESMMYIPGLTRFTAKQKNIRASGNAVAIAKLRARKVLGTAAIAGLWYAAEEDMITGSGPADYKLRADWKASGYEPNSIRVGDQWVSYSKLGPIGLLMGLTADLHWIWNKDMSGTNTQDAILEYTAATVYAVTNNVLNKAYFSAISDLIEGLQSPDKLARTMEGFALSFTPNLLNQINNDPNVKEASQMLEKLQRRIPLISEKLGNQYDLYGRAITKPRHDIPVYGYMFKNREVVKDPVAEQVYKLGAGLDRAILSKPSYGIGVTNTDYRDVYDFGETESVYAKYNRFIGEERIGGLTLHKALGRLIRSEEYKNAPYSGEGDITPPKVKLITNMVNGYRNEAKARLHNESREFRKQMRTRNKRVEDLLN